MNKIIKEKIYLFVPYCDKNEVKNYGGKYDVDKKQWYIENENIFLIEKWGKEIKKIYIKVPFKYRNLAKSNGALWDKDEKKWFVYNNKDYLTINNYIKDAEEM